MKLLIKLYKSCTFIDFFARNVTWDFTSLHEALGNMKKWNEFLFATAREPFCSEILEP